MKTSISDQYMVYAVHRHNTNHQQHLTIQYRSFKNFDQDAYEIDLQSADWSTVYNAHTTDEASDNLHLILIKTVNKICPIERKENPSTECSLD